MSVTGSRRDAITYGVNGTRSSCGDRGVSWVYWCGWGARATILFVGAGAAQDGIREAALESYAERLLLTSDLPRISGFTMRVCSGAVLRSLMTWSVSVLCPVREGVGLRPLAVGYGKVRVLCGTGVGGAVLVLDDGDPPRRPMRSGGVGRVLAGLRLTESVTLVTISVVRDTPPDCHFSAWSRPKPAPDPLPGPSVASGVIPTKGGRNGPVPATSGRASTGRWRSSPWKRCNHAPPRSRVREHPAPLGALRHGGLAHHDGTVGPSGSTPHR